MWKSLCPKLSGLSKKSYFLLLLCDLFWWLCSPDILFLCFSHSLSCFVCSYNLRIMFFWILQLSCSFSSIFQKMKYEYLFSCEYYLLELWHLIHCNLSVNLTGRLKLTDSFISICLPSKYINWITRFCLLSVFWKQRSWKAVWNGGLLSVIWML